MKILHSLFLAAVIIGWVGGTVRTDAEAATDEKKAAGRSSGVVQEVAKLGEATQKAMADPQVKAALDTAKAAGAELSKTMAAKMKALDPGAESLFAKDRKSLTADERKKLAELHKRVLADPQVKEACERCKAVAREAQQRLHAKMKEIEPTLASIIDTLEQRPIEVSDKPANPGNAPEKTAGPQGAAP